VYLGTISYSVYLVHALVLLLPRPDLPRPAAFAVMLAATIGGAALTYHFIEKPGQQVGRVVMKRYRDARTDAPAAADDPSTAADPPAPRDTSPTGRPAADDVPAEGNGPAADHGPAAAGRQLTGSEARRPGA